MNAETIELLRAVQKYRGEWRKFDPCWHEKHGFGTIDTVRKDEVLVEFNKSPGTFFSFGPDDPDLLWLPPTAPGWNDDGRNLWAMVDWKKWGICVDENRRILIHERKYDIVYFEADTLPEALLRAAVGKGE